ncbi:hypothetical protein GT037_010160 [Alternaria burnsii]|uniref:Uncharacterized protein n=1 Tax=Alternaria burnsii TaxID=1187904 RepID=A0A8H7AZ01_9PLEO|nr:uncharacterized protein GT037_010160 [Alternaria burnsii]KAF7671638.1 hypothetical protein GT037_010160 [Alternaria burnsii]
MCHKLLQAYACDHKRIVCTTPCPHAIATGRQISNDLCKTVPELSRSSSAVSSMTPSANGPPLRATVLSSQVQGLQQSGHTPAFRFIAPTTGQEATSVGLPVSTSPISPFSNQPSPAFSNANSLIEPVSSSPSTSLTPADPEPDTGC